MPIVVVKFCCKQIMIIIIGSMGLILGKHCHLVIPAASQKPPDPFIQTEESLYLIVLIFFIVIL